jgi:hypothetical protein
MKAIGVGLFILGIVLFVGGSAGVEIGKIWPAPYICSVAEKDQKEAELAAARKSFQGNGAEFILLKKREEEMRFLDESTRRCAEQRSKIKFRVAISSLVAHFGFLLSVAAFFTGRQKTNELF